MNALTGPPRELMAVCERWAAEMAGRDDENARLDYIVAELPQLLRNRGLFLDILRSAAAGGIYPDTRQATMFEDELILHLNSRRLFSLRAFVYAPGAFTPVHDHNSWGVSGAVLGEVTVIRYRREDDGAAEGYAKLSLCHRLVLKPGDVEVTRPLEAGIHQTGNRTRQTVLMLSVYGNPIRRLHINRFDIARDRVTRMFPPRMKKKMLAKAALAVMENRSG